MFLDHGKTFLPSLVMPKYGLHNVTQVSIMFHDGDVYDFIDILYLDWQMRYTSNNMVLNLVPRHGEGRCRGMYVTDFVDG